MARPAEEITLRQIIEAVEGPIALSQCLAPWEKCDRMETCSVHPVLARAQQQLLAALDATTLKDLANGQRGPHGQPADRPSGEVSLAQ